VAQGLCAGAQHERIGGLHGGSPVPATRGLHGKQVIPARMHYNPQRGQMIDENEEQVSR
jgi:hypothetical protein